MRIAKYIIFGLSLVGFCASEPILGLRSANAGDLIKVLKKPGRVIINEGRKLISSVTPGAKQKKRRAATPIVKKPSAPARKVVVKKTPQSAPVVHMPAPVATAKEVAFINHYQIGTIVINATTGVLYLVDSNETARRYSISFGKDVRNLHGQATLKSKAKWPDWVPGYDLLRTDPQLYARYKSGVGGGPESPLGARALYLYQQGKEEPLLIHGITSLSPQTSADFDLGYRMKNELIIDLFERVATEAPVVIL